MIVSAVIKVCISLFLYQRYTGRLLIIQLFIIFIFLYSNLASGAHLERMVMLVTDLLGKLMSLK